jgi:hypothetical protein
MATVAVPADRKIRIRNSAGNAEAIVDLLGYYSAASTSTYQPKDVPAVVLDTRNGTGGPLAANGTLAEQMRGVGGIPADATAVAVNVTVTESKGGGYLAVFSQERGLPSTLNYKTGEDRANQAIVSIAGDGKIRVYNGSGGTAHVLIAVVGWFTPADDGNRFAAMRNPVRLVDTRNGSGQPVGTTAFSVTVTNSVPTQATVAALNYTTVGATAKAHLTAWGHGLPFPSTASSLNVAPGDVNANSVTARIGTQGKVDIVGNTGTVHVIADLAGYYIK